MAKHSSIVGGSNAGRLLNCPASYQAILALPPSTDVSSDYAEEGTFAHEVMDELMRVRQQGIAPEQLPGVARSWVTREFYDRKLTYEHCDSMIIPALAHLEELESQYGGPFQVVGIEARVAFPGLPGAFGTVDLILQSPNYVLHVDWKFGSGVGVAAVYQRRRGRNRQSAADVLPDRRAQDLPDALRRTPRHGGGDHPAARRRAAHLHRWSSGANSGNSPKTSTMPCCSRSAAIRRACAASTAALPRARWRARTGPGRCSTSRRSSPVHPDTGAHRDGE